MEAYSDPPEEFTQQDWEAAVQARGQKDGLPPGIISWILCRMGIAAEKVGRDPAYVPAARLDFFVHAFEEALDGYPYTVGWEEQRGEDAPSRRLWVALLKDLHRVPRRKRIYVAGPYRAATPEGIARNIAEAREAAGELLIRGHAPFCPHTMTGHFEDHFPEIEAQVYLETDLEWLPWCDAILLLPGWQRSDGTLEELRQAVSMGLEVYWTLEDVPDASAEPS